MRRRICGAVVLAALAWSGSPNLFAAHAEVSLPGPPTNVSAQAGTLSAVVQWVPADSLATSYTVTSSPRGITTTVGGTATSATVTGLAFATRYTFTVAATNGIGTGPSSAPSNPVTPDAPGGPYHQGAARVLSNNVVVAGTPSAFNIGQDRVHAPGLSAIVLNVTASAATQTAIAQLTMRGQVAATVAVSPGTVDSSLVVVTVPEQMNPAAVQLTAGQAQIEVDFVGFFTDPRTVGDGSGLLQMIPTTTVFDSQLPVGGSEEIPMLGQGDVPSAHVAGVLLNVTALDPGGAGAIALLPAGTSDPGTVSLGFAAGQTTSNRAIVPLPASGDITVLDRGAAVQAHVDVLGWFTDGTDPTAVGALYTPLPPTRVADTSAGAGPVAAGGSLTFPIWGQGGAPDGSTPGPATSALVQVTVSSAAGTGAIVLAGTPIIDFAAGQTLVGDSVVQVTYPSGTAALEVLGAAANVTVDLVAYFSGDLIMPGSTKVLSPVQLAGITSMGSDDTITFAPGDQVSPPVAINDVIVAGPSAATPNGLLRRVLSISTTADGSTVFATRAAAVPEAITSFFLDWTLPPTAGAFGMGHGASANATVSRPVTSPNPLPPPPNTSIDPKWPSFFVAKPPAGVEFDLSKLDPGLHNGSAIDLNDLELQARVGLLMNLSSSGKFTMHVGFGVGVRASIDVQLLAELQLLDKKGLLEHFFPVGPPIFIWIGIFIFEFQPGIDASLEVQINLLGGLIIHEGLDRYLEVSGGYDGKSFFLDPLTYKNYLAPAQEANLRPSVQAQFELDVHLDPGLAFYGGVASIDGDLIPFARVTVDPLAPHWWDFTLGLCFQFEFKLNLIFLTNDHAFLPVCFTFTVIEAPGRLLAITVTPNPATVSRSGTQHFHASVPLSPNGVIWSIDESGGGGLSNATQFDVDYSAPNAVGTYHLRAEAVDDPTSAIEVPITVSPVAPSPPTNVTAALSGTSSVTVSWSPPADDGGAPVIGYHVTASPGGASVDTNQTTTSAIFVNVPPGTYTFTVAAENAALMTSPPSLPSNPITIVPAGPMSVVPTSIAFGNVTLGQSSAPQTVVVTADGVPLVISTVTVGGANPGEFTIQSDTCSGQTIQPGSTCSFALSYVPTMQITANAVVTITDSDSTSPQTVTLTGSSPVPAVSGVVPVYDIQMIDSQTGYALEASIGSAIVKTTDGGKTWNRLILPAFDQLSTTGSGYNFRFVDAANGFVAGIRKLSGGGQVSVILATVDGGQTWREIAIPNGIPISSMWFSDTSHGWIVGGVAGPPAPPGSLVNSVLAAVYATTDGGTTWTQQSLSDPIIAGTAGCIGQEGNISARFVDSSKGWLSGTTICFAPNATITTRGALVWTTSDGGATWTANQPSSVDGVGPARIQVTSASQMRQPGVVNVTSAAQQVLVSSDDDGASFTTAALPISGPPVADSFSDGSHGVLLTSDGHVLRTTDGGATWQSTTLPRFVSSAGRITQYSYRAIESPDGTNIWITGSVLYGFAQAGFIEHSSDGGATWAVQLLGSGG